MSAYAIYKSAWITAIFLAIDNILKPHLSNYLTGWYLPCPCLPRRRPLWSGSPGRTPPAPENCDITHRLTWKSMVNLFHGRIRLKYCRKEIFVRYRHMTKLFFNICSCKLLKANTKNLLIICKTRKCTKMTNEFWKMTKKEKYKCIFSGNGNITMALGIP